MSSPEPATSGSPCGERRLSEAALSLVAARFAALADPMRLRLVHLLFEGELGMQALIERSGGSQTNVSRHLHTLADAGILGRRKDGLQVYYHIADPTVHDLCELTCESLGRQLAERARVFNGGA